MCMERAQDGNPKEAIRKSIKKIDNQLKKNWQDLGEYLTNNPKEIDHQFIIQTSCTVAGLKAERRSLYDSLQSPHPYVACWAGHHRGDCFMNKPTMNIKDIGRCTEADREICTYKDIRPTNGCGEQPIMELPLMDTMEAHYHLHGIDPKGVELKAQSAEYMKPCGEIFICEPTEVTIPRPDVEETIIYSPEDTRAMEAARRNQEDSLPQHLYPNQD